MLLQVDVGQYERLKKVFFVQTPITRKRVRVHEHGKKLARVK